MRKLSAETLYDTHLSASLREELDERANEVVRADPITVEGLVAEAYSCRVHAVWLKERTASHPDALLIHRDRERLLLDTARELLAEAKE